MERIAQYEQMIRDIQADPEIKEKARFIAFLERVIEEERAANSGSNFRRFLGGLRERNQSSTSRSRSQTRRSTSRRHRSRASNGSTRRRNRNGSR